jgi:hypothetical protein
MKELFNICSQLLKNKNMDSFDQPDETPLGLFACSTTGKGSMWSSSFQNIDCSIVSRIQIVRNVSSIFVRGVYESPPGTTSPRLPTVLWSRNATIAQQVSRLTGTSILSGKDLARQLHTRSHAANELSRRSAFANRPENPNPFHWLGAGGDT